MRKELSLDEKLEYIEQVSNNDVKGLRYLQEITASGQYCYAGYHDWEHVWHGNLLASECRNCGSIEA